MSRHPHVVSNEAYRRIDVQYGQQAEVGCSARTLHCWDTSGLPPCLMSMEEPACLWRLSELMKTVMRGYLSSGNCRMDAGRFCFSLTAVETH